MGLFNGKEMPLKCNEMKKQLFAMGFRYLC